MLPAHLSLSGRGFMVLSWQRRAYGDCKDDDGDGRVFRTGRAAWLIEISVKEVFLYFLHLSQLFFIILPRHEIYCQMQPVRSRLRG